MIELLQKRFACKKFDGRRITDKQLHTLKESIRLSPSSLNGQPWKIKIVADAETKELLGPHSKHNAEKIRQCSHLFVFCTVNDQAARFEEITKVMEREPSLAFNLDRYEKMIPAFIQSKDAQSMLHWQQRQTFLPLMSLMLQATALGLDSCPMEGFNPDKYAESLDITDATPLVLCAIGFRAMDPPKKVRLAQEHVFL